LLLMVTMVALTGLTGAGLWYRDHLRDQQRREGERIAELHTKNTVALFKAQDDLEQKEWCRAEATLSTVFAAIEDGCDRAGARDYAAFPGFFFLEPS
jgi:hypothetical protein